ncbi:AraC family transcriptional regulator [Aliikangiella coralliicola]|uniref:AraC family transcriptional regulator n=1 Tax=Aliikangiella coralliicola TaxID=2592383 RepID=A0A545UFJ1_9GAMM|nr:helix-turn-helix domain-containing protein [Aliikangiella coralliicola]TQV88242.1 AraC family transcriptional regulator [Aliikangiella coralliicola]
MDWSKRMNLAIEFIEDNLDGEIAIDEVAKIAYSSKYHFHRMFYAIFNVTPAEYIRKRKLTKAAAELVSGDERVIDIASKYGYDSPNAFTRAFRKLHGVNPGKVRSSQVKLSAYNRVSFQLETKGKAMLDYRIIEKPAFKVRGKSKDFEFDQFVKEGRKFWKEYVSSNEYNLLFELTSGRCGPVSEAPLMSVYFPNEQGNKEAFTDVLAIENTSEIDSNKFDTYSIPTATYAEFNCTYQTSMKTNRYIYGEWFASTGYERDGNKPDIAAYFPIAFRPMRDMGIRWWIPVIKK